MIGNRIVSRPFGIFCGVFCLAAAWSQMVAAQEIDPLDWPHWRGPEMNGISREKGLPNSWSPEGENLIWKSAELGTRSTPIVMRGKLYVLCRHNPDTVTEGEKVVCVDAATGAKVWENSFNVFLTDAPAERVGWSCVCGDPTTGNVYALGLCDYFQCLDGATGKTIWSHSMSEEYGMISTYGGRTNMPLVFDDLVIISGVMTGWGEYAVPAHRFVAFDKTNGQAVWISSTRLRPLDTTYSSPVLANFNGQMAIVFGSGDGSVYAMQPRTGKILWTYDASLRGINTTPTVVGNSVFCGHAEENVFDTTVMGALFAIDGTGTGNVTKTKEQWIKPTVMLGRAAPLFVNDRLYIVDDGAMLSVRDSKTGNEIGKQKLGTGEVFSSPLYADGKIYCAIRSGITAILEPTEKGVKVVHKQRLEGDLIHGSAIASHGRVYIPTSDALYCIGNKDQAPVAPDPRPAVPEEAPWSADRTPAQLQLTPVESLLRPKAGQSSGQTQTIGFRLFNANGRYLDSKSVKPVYELKGPGKIEPSKEAGKENQVVFTPDPNAGHAASFVTAKVGELTSTARIRTVPNFPWSFDFSNGKIPETWIGSAYRHIVLDDDLLQSLKTQNPRAAQLYIYLTTAFVNGNAPTIKFQDAGPRQAWNDLLRYFDLSDEGKPATIDDAKKEFDAGLELLAKEKVIEKWDWSQDAAGNLELTVNRGSRGIAGNAVMCKITTIPKGTRSQGWMGQTHLHDYTIQADVRGTVRNNKMPAMGVINQRYTLALESDVEFEGQGAIPALQIRSWASQLDLRFAKSIPFAWKYDAWYTLKFQSENKDGKVTLRGKVWPRGEAEPADWTIEGTDETPNVTGSPGLFGNAGNAEVFVDNVKVTAN
ncbi:MAG: PQQ-binding-like beta-propeller repeat protein [Planctomycetia bacterium]|nr:PQQ-binding-like beta-propeller repeat protein [Planctomycetia bacterium]